MTAIICTYTKKAIDKTTYDYYESTIAQAVDSPEGRVALAQAMVGPMARAMDYQSIGRRLLMVDELPQGALARNVEVEPVVYTLDRRGPILDRAVESEEVLVPTFEIATNPQIRLREIRNRRFEIESNPIKVYVSENK